MRTASFGDVRSGRVTDVYFERTREILLRENIHRQVTVEVKAMALTDGYSWGVGVRSPK
jgi:nicotinate phosphoribosyltransferase